MCVCVCVCNMAVLSAGRQQIHAFLEAGRGFVGECAGAFLATQDYFGFLEKVRVENIQHWKRGEVLL